MGVDRPVSPRLAVIRLSYHGSRHVPGAGGARGQFIDLPSEWGSIDAGSMCRVDNKLELGTSNGLQPLTTAKALTPRMMVARTMARVRR